MSEEGTPARCCCGRDAATVYRAVPLCEEHYAALMQFPPELRPQMSMLLAPDNDARDAATEKLNLTGRVAITLDAEGNITDVS